MKLERTQLAVFTIVTRIAFTRPADRIASLTMDTATLEPTSITVESIRTWNGTAFSIETFTEDKSKLIIQCCGELR